MIHGGLVIFEPKFGVFFYYRLIFNYILKLIILVSKTVLIMVLVGAFATAVIIAEDDVFAEDIQTKLTKKVDTTTKELEKDKINKACIEMDKFLQDTNNLVEKDKLAQTDADLLLDSGQNIKDTIGCT